MLEQLPASGRVGDGFGDAKLAANVAEALPFMQFAIEDTSLPGNQSGRMPSNDPDHWLAVHNCGPASKSLDQFLTERGYDTTLMCDPDYTHMFVRVELPDRKAYVDPTALQFLSKYEVRASHADSHGQLDDESGLMLPNERVLIFDPEDYENVGEWLAIVVKRYWQTKTLGLYAASHMSMYPGPIARRKRALTRSQHEIAEYLAQRYHPDNVIPYDQDVLVDYQEMYGAWLSGVKPHSWRRSR